MDDELRIIAGRLRHRIISIPRSAKARPALVLVRRMICDTLMPFLPDSTALDLFAGTGAFVFEVVSRGAACATAIDLDPVMAESIRSNAESLEISDQIAVMNMDYLAALTQLASRGKKFDLIFIAPPFYHDYVNLALKAIDENGILNQQGVIVAHYHKRDKVNRKYKLYSLWKTKIHGVSVMDFYKGIS